MSQNNQQVESAPKAAAAAAAELEASKQDSLSSSNSSSPSNSISLIKLDELSSFGATKQSRLPALIKLSPLDDRQKQTNSMPAFDVDKLEQSSQDKRQSSLPAKLTASSNKENLMEAEPSDLGDFQVLELSTDDQEAQLGPSLPPKSSDESALKATQAAQYPSHLGDSLIEMVINLRNENQNLVRALEANNEYVKERLSEFKRAQEEAKEREAQFAKQKADHEHQVRKLQRQNAVLSDRLKIMEAKLKDMRLEVGESLAAAHSSRASSVHAPPEALYPELEAHSFSNQALSQPQATDQTMQMEAPSPPIEPTAPPATETQAQASRVAAMSSDELNEYFHHPSKQANQPMDTTNDEDPMKQCDALEKQLNDIGKRDYEICLLQQQLNIYRQDFRLERMANLEAKLQIERLKEDIERLCFERAGRSGEREPCDMQRNSRHRSSAKGAASVAAAADHVGKLGLQLSRRAAKSAARSAAKAAKYAAKQAHLEEKAAAFATRAAANSSAGTAPSTGAQANAPEQHQRRHQRARGIRSEVVNDLLSTANKAMLTGYKMASTHVNLALDKLSQYEQEQANNLAANRPTANKDPSAPIGPPSVD